MAAVLFRGVVGIMFSALLLTILIETPIILIGFRKEKHFIGGIGKLILNSVLINAITNVTMNALISLIGPYALFILGSGFIIFLLVLEALVVCVERKMFNYVFDDAVSGGKVTRVVLLANAVSFLIGILITAVITGFPIFAFFASIF